MLPLFSFRPIALLKITGVILFCAVISGCTIFKGEKIYPIPTSEYNNIKISENKICLGDKTFAELKIFAKGRVIYGIAIHYSDLDRWFWIYPEEGLNLRGSESNEKYSLIDELEKHWDEAGYRIYYGDKNIESVKLWPIVFGVYDIHISSDGRSVYYARSGLFYNTIYKYYVEYGYSREIWSELRE